MPPKDQVRKRTRKRKRRQALSSSSSSSSSNSDTDEASAPVASKTPAVERNAPPTIEQNSSSSSETDSSTSSSDSESTDKAGADVEMKSPTRAQNLPPSRSPSTASYEMQTGLPLQPTTEAEKERDARFRERFRQFWMKSMAEGFGDELAQLQKVCLLLLLLPAF